MSNFEPHPGIVLRVFPAKSSDLILTILTKDLGKLSALARGARSSKKRFFGGLDLFDCGIFELQGPKNNQNLWSVGELSRREIWLSLRENLQTFSLASCLLEVTNIFAQEGDPEGSELFPLLYLSLKNLNKVKEENQKYLCLIYYFLSLLRVSGFDPLASSGDLSEPLTSWFAQMLESKSASIPSSDPDEARELIKLGFNKLLANIQDIHGYPLSSKDSVVFG